jgi:hypothetical protein
VNRSFVNFRNSIFRATISVAIAEEAGGMTMSGNKNKGLGRKDYAHELLAIKNQAMQLAASGQSLRSIYMHYRERGVISMSFETFYRYMKKSAQIDESVEMSRNNPIDYLIMILMRNNFPLKSIYMFLQQKELCNVSYATFCRYINGEMVVYCCEHLHFDRISSLIEEFYLKKELYMSYETKNFHDRQNMCAIKRGRLIIPQSIVKTLCIEDSTAVKALYDTKNRQIALKFYPVRERNTLEVITYPSLDGAKLVVPFSGFCRNFNLIFRHVVYLPLNMDYGLQPGGDPFDLILDVDGAQRSPVGIAFSLRRMANGYAAGVMSDSGAAAAYVQ